MTSSEPSDPRAKRVASAQAFLRRVGHRDFHEVLDLLSEHVTYRVPGGSGIAGTFTGRDAVIKHLTDLADLTLGTLDGVKWEDWMIGESHVAALVRVHMQPHGRLYEGTHLYLLRFDVDDLIDEIMVFFEDEGAVSRMLAN